MIANTPDYAYLNERLAELGISDQQNTFHRVWYQKSDALDAAGGAQPRIPKILKRFNP